LAQGDINDSRLFQMGKIMTKCSLAIAAVAILTLATGVMACGPNEYPAGGGGYSGKVAGYYGGVNPMVAQQMAMQPQMQMYAAMQQQQQQMMMARQVFAMQAAAHRARMAPIRLARAKMLREQELARRQEVRAAFIAKPEEKRRRKAGLTPESNSPNSPVADGPILLSSVIR